jgi:hypothetical protein
MSKRKESINNEIYNFKKNKIDNNNNLEPMYSEEIPFINEYKFIENELKKIELLKCSTNYIEPFINLEDYLELKIQNNLLKKCLEELQSKILYTNNNNNIIIINNKINFIKKQIDFIKNNINNNLQIELSKFLIVKLDINYNNIGIIRWKKFL